MAEHDQLADQFEQHRSHLRAVAYRMLGSLSEADDAVQEAWLRLSRAETDEVRNLGGWLTTVVARICLDMLRSRTARREEPLDAQAAPIVSRSRANDPEQEALLADSVGLALLVVLETLTPDERLAFVLHDMFAVPFTEIAPIVGRTTATARQLASRARRRVQAPPAVPQDAFTRQRAVIDAFLTAARGGDFAAMLAILDPNIVLRMERAQAGLPIEIHGAAAVAEQAMRGGARAARAILVNGSVGVVVAPRGRLLMVLAFTIEGDRVVAIDRIDGPEHLDRLDLAVLSD